MFSSPERKALARRTGWESSYARSLNFEGLTQFPFNQPKVTPCNVLTGTLGSRALVDFTVHWGVRGADGLGNHRRAVSAVGLQEGLGPLTVMPRLDEPAGAAMLPGAPPLEVRDALGNLILGWVPLLNTVKGPGIAISAQFDARFHTQGNPGEARRLLTPTVQAWLLRQLNPLSWSVEGGMLASVSHEACSAGQLIDHLRLLSALAELLEESAGGGAAPSQLRRLLQLSPQQPLPQSAAPSPELPEQSALALPGSAAALPGSAGSRWPRTVLGALGGGMAGALVPLTGVVSASAYFPYLLGGLGTAGAAALGGLMLRGASRKGAASAEALATWQARGALTRLAAMQRYSYRPEARVPQQTWPVFPLTERTAAQAYNIIEGRSPRPFTALEYYWRPPMLGTLQRRTVVAMHVGWGAERLSLEPATAGLTSFEPSLAASGIERVRVGVPEFDERFYLAGEPAEWVRKVLSGPVRALLLAHGSELSWTLAGGALCCVSHERLTPALLGRVLTALGAVADSMEAQSALLQKSTTGK